MSVAILSGAMVGQHSKGIFASSRNPVIVENLETIRTAAGILMVVSFLMIVYASFKISESFNGGFFKMNLQRINVAGRIFYWSEVSRVRFTLNITGVFGEREAKDGFKNWIEFMHQGATYRHEFYLKNAVMEANFLDLLPLIRTKDGVVKY